MSNLIPLVLARHNRRDLKFTGRIIAQSVNEDLVTMTLYQTEGGQFVFHETGENFDVVQVFPKVGNFLFYLGVEELLTAETRSFLEEAASNCPELEGSWVETIS